MRVSRRDLNRLTVSCLLTFVLLAFPVPCLGSGISPADAGGVSSQVAIFPSGPPESLNTELVDQFGGPTLALAVEGNYAYLGAGFSVIVVDVSDADNPLPVGKSAPLPAVIRDLAVAGGALYVANDFAGLRILDLSNPARPTEVGSLDTPGYAQAVEVVGQYAYVADDFAGLRIINISDPARPIEASFYDTPGIVSDVAVSGSLAYVCDGFFGFRVIDVSNPTAPLQTGFLPTFDLAFSVAITGAVAYVGQHGADPFAEGRLSVIDISNPQDPKEVGAFVLPRVIGNKTPIIVRITVTANYAYLADEGLGWWTYRTRAALWRSPSTISTALPRR